MIEIIDGPAAGHTLTLRRAPLYLRVVIAPDGTVDALDQLDDVARPEERIHVYERHADGPSGQVHVCGRGPGAASGWYAIGRYRHLAGPPPSESILRDREAWRAWCRRDPAGLRQDTPTETPS